MRKPIFKRNSVYKIVIELRKNVFFKLMGLNLICLASWAPLQIFEKSNMREIAFNPALNLSAFSPLNALLA